MNKRRTILSLALFSVIVMTAFGASAVFADTDAIPASTADIPLVTLEVPIGSTTEVRGLGQYVSVFYQFAVSATAIIAAVMIMYSGISWLTAAGNSSRIGEAKERIIAAISGLILAMMSYAILSTINPALVVLQSPTILVTAVPATISETASGSDSATATTSSCNMTLVNIRTEMAAKHPEVLSYLASDGSVVQDVIDPLAAALKSAYTNGMLLHFSGARSMASQTSLYNCYISSKDLAGWSAGKCSNGCSTCAVAAAPNCSAPHLTGRALDMGWYPRTASSSSDETVKTPYYNTNQARAKGYCNGGGSGSCYCGSASSAACVGLATSQAKLQTIMGDIGFNRICIEAWHFEYGLSGDYCAPGSYK